MLESIGAFRFGLLLLQLALLVFIVTYSGRQDRDEERRRSVPTWIFVAAVVAVALIGLWLLRATPVALVVLEVGLAVIVATAALSRRRQAQSAREIRSRPIRVEVRRSRGHRSHLGPERIGVDLRLTSGCGGR